MVAVVCAVGVCMFVERILYPSNGKLLHLKLKHCHLRLVF